MKWTTDPAKIVNDIDNGFNLSWNTDTILILLQDFIVGYCDESDFRSYLEIVVENDLYQDDEGALDFGGKDGEGW